MTCRTLAGLRLAFALGWAALALTGCGKSAGNPPTNTADAGQAEVGPEAPLAPPDARAVDAAAEAPPDARAVDAAAEAPPDVARGDASSDAPADVAADAPAELRPDAAETGLASDAADAPAEAGPDAAAEGGCVPVPAPAVRWLNPLPQGNPLHGVWGSGASDVYAVGDYGTILHSADRGQSWQPLVSGTTEALDAVWGSGASDVYVVGAQGTILHTADGGGTWTSMSLATGRGLRAIWGSSADDVYAVGDTGLIAHRVAQGAWTMQTQNSEATTPTYRGVYGSGGSVWVVGDSPSLVRSIDDGATWADVFVQRPNTLDSFAAMTSVGGTLYLAAYGEQTDANLYTSTNGGTSWNAIRTPDGQPTMGLASGGGSAYAVGASGVFLVAANGGATFAPLASGTTTTLNAVWASVQGELFAVGDAGIMLHADSAAGAITGTPAVTRNELARIWGSPAGDLIAIGNMPEVVQSSDRGAHFALRTPTGAADALPPSLLGLGGLGDDVYASGFGGIVHSADRGVTWTSDYYNVDGIDAVMLNADGVYAVGPAQYVLHKPVGGAWTMIPIAGGQGGMGDLWSGGGEIWAVGGGSALHAVAGVFSFLPRSAVGGAIWGPSTSDLVTAGGEAEITRSTDDGASWNYETACWPPDQLAVQPAKATSALDAVCGGGGRMFIVGQAGAVLVSRDNVNWTSVPAGTSQGLTGCTVTDDGTLIVAGNGGTILELTFP